ncbi:MAG: CPBP family intramembrane glutamic endopeptidase [Deltaproteobacteria bacterium]
MPRIAPAGRAGGPPPTTRELLLSWCWVVGGIGAASVLAGLDPTGLLRANLAGIAAILFVLVPDRKLRERGEGWSQYGLGWWGLDDARTWRAWGSGAAQGLLVSLLVLPPFAAAVVAATRLAGLPGDFHLRLPPGFAMAALVQLLVVALPEELFYRGWMQTAWARSGPTRTLLGAAVGPGFLATQVLFAAGHLITLQPWRLATFFPALLFGWLRARTGGVAAPVVAHTLSNLLVLVLQASLAPPG